MKRAVISSFLLLFAVSAIAQTKLDVKAVAEKSFGPVSKGEFTIESVSFHVGSNNTDHTSYRLMLGQKGHSKEFDTFNMPNKMALSPANNSLEDYWILRNICSLGSLSKLKDLYATRSEMEEEANNYVSNLEKYGMIFDDPFLESYIYSIVSRIVPSRRADGFPYDIRVVILKDDSMNACVFPNGTLVVNTGLLAAVHTEDELVAAIGHEIGHYIANHSLVNLQKSEQRQARAEFWAAFATGVAAATEIGAAYHGYYTGGTLTASTAIISSAIAMDIINRLGVDFSREQEADADEMAIKVLGYLGYDTNACATLFNRMSDVFNTEGNWAAYYLTGDHPSLKDRIEATGTPYDRIDPNFEKKVSFAVTSAAITKYQMGRFTQALKLVDQNIKNGVATDDDLLIKALCLISLRDDASSNREAYNCVQTAKQYNPSNKNIRRAEIIAADRLGMHSETLKLLDEYKSELQDSMSALDPDSYTYSYISSEFEWARKMYIKAQGMK